MIPHIHRHPQLSLALAGLFIAPILFGMPRQFRSDPMPGLFGTTAESEWILHYPIGPYSHVVAFLSIEK